jgi:dihydroorotase
LERKPAKVPDAIDAADTRVVPFHAGRTLEWSFTGVA